MSSVRCVCSSEDFKVESDFVDICVRKECDGAWLMTCSKIASILPGGVTGLPALGFGGDAQLSQAIFDPFCQMLLENPLRWFNIRGSTFCTISTLLST